MSDLARIMGKVKSGAANECWPWTGYVASSGYGRACIKNKIRNAHRVVWELHAGQAAPQGMVVRHKCDNRVCCNPAHLEIGTYKQNAQDTIDRGRHPSLNSTHCRNGHEYTPENTRYAPWKSSRTCLTCRRESDRNQRQRKLLSSLSPAQLAKRKIVNAAPEMLAALRLAREALGANAARDAVDAAIAKATE